MGTNAKLYVKKEEFKNFPFLFSLKHEAIHQSLKIAL